MLDPPQRRKPATELEVKLARGDPAVQGALVELLDGVLHKDLQHIYPTLLPDDERARIVVEVIADVISGKVPYDPNQAAIETCAKRRARWRARDYFRRRKVAANAMPALLRQEALLRPVEDPAEAFARSEAVAERERMIERLTVEIEQLPQNLRRAALAYMRHGDSDPAHGGKAYSTILADELGIEPQLVSQWWCRAKRRLRKSVAKDLVLAEKRSIS